MLRFLKRKYGELKRSDTGMASALWWGKRLVRFPDPTYGVGRENEPLRSWEKTLESQNSKNFNGDHQKLMLIGKLRTWRGY